MIKQMTVSYMTQMEGRNMEVFPVFISRRAAESSWQLRHSAGASATSHSELFYSQIRQLGIEIVRPGSCPTLYSTLPLTIQMGWRLQHAAICPRQCQTATKDFGVLRVRAGVCADKCRHQWKKKERRAQRAASGHAERLLAVRRKRVTHGV